MAFITEGTYADRLPVAPVRRSEGLRKPFLRQWTNATPLCSRYGTGRNGSRQVAMIRYIPGWPAVLTAFTITSGACLAVLAATAGVVAGTSRMKVSFAVLLVAGLPGG